MSSVVQGRTLLEIVDAGRVRGEAVAIRTIGQRGLQDWSWRRLAGAIDGFAAELRNAGAGGGAVALIGPNSPEWVAAYFAIIQAGAVAVPIDAGLGDADASLLIAAAGCRTCVTNRDRIERLRAQANAPDVRFIEMEHAAAATSAAPAPAPAIGPDSEASYLFTSGTTGAPKIVPLTHRNLGHCVAAILSARVIERGDSVLLPLPLHHIYPFTVGLLSTLAGGGTVVFPEGLSGPQIIEALQTARPHILVGVPRLFEALVLAIEGRVAVQGGLARAGFRILLQLSALLRGRGGAGPGRYLFPALHRHFGSRLRTLACGGARLDEDTWKRLEELGWEVLTGYGLTETSPLITFNPRGRARRGTEGVPIAGVEVRIEPREDAAFGEILVRGPSVFSGYRNNPEKNRTAFKDGWFRTGDLGVLDADGYLRVAGRADELIVLPDGKKVFPERIERVYSECAFVKEVAVLAHDGRLVAIVVPDLDAFRERGTARVRGRINDEIELVGQRLARYERVAGTAIVTTALPRTRLGKLRRHLLPDIYSRASSGAEETATAGATAPPPPPASATPIERRLWEWLVRRFPGKRLTTEASLQLDFGIDSVDWINLTLELQQALGVRLTDQAMSKVITVRDLMVAITAAQSSPAGAPREEIAVGDRRWLEPRGVAAAVAARCLHGLLRVVFRLAFRVRAEGVASLPETGPLIIAPNHVSFLDPFVLIAVLPWRVLCNTYWAAWTGHMFSGPLQRLLAGIAQAIPVDPDRGPAAGLALAAELLDRKKLVVWFPEGQRSSSGELLPFTTGIGILIARTGSPVLPVHISGTYAALPRGQRWPRPSRVRVRLGRPITRESLQAEGSGGAEAHISEALRRHVLALAGKQ